jgi:hypothetical protein
VHNEYDKASQAPIVLTSMHATSGPGTRRSITILPHGRPHTFNAARIAYLLLLGDNEDRNTEGRSCGLLQ